MTSIGPVDLPDDLLEPWQAAALLVLALPAQHYHRLHHHEVPHPGEAGFRRSKGMNLRAKEHYRRALPDGRGLHVQRFHDHYRIHWDAKDPSVSPFGHLLSDVVRTIVRPVRRLWNEHA